MPFQGLRAMQHARSLQCYTGKAHAIMHGIKVHFSHILILFFCTASKWCGAAPFSLACSIFLSLFKLLFVCIIFPPCVDSEQSPMVLCIA